MSHSAYLLRILALGRALVDSCDVALQSLFGRRFRRGFGLVFALSSTTVAATLVALLRRRLLPGPHAAVGQQLHFDYVVVGGGSAGCVLAARLSEQEPAARVLLLEAGQDESCDRNIQVPLAATELQKTAVDWAFETEPHEATSHRVHKWPRGKVLGGSSCLNWMLYVRGNPGDYDLWASPEYGCSGWAYADVLPYFMRAQRREVESAWNTTGRVDDSFQGTSGPVVVSDVQEPNTVTKTFIAAAQSVGIPFNADLNGHNQLGVGHAQLTIDNGRRCSTVYAYLTPEVRRRPNLTIALGAHVTRVLFDIDHSRAVGVEYRLEGSSRVHRVHAVREVVLSCGSVSTPHLLLRSGVGPKQHLRDFGIPVIRDLPYVGEQMQDHMFLVVPFSVTKPITMDRELVDNMKNVLKYVLFKKGPLTSQGLESMAFVRTEHAHLPDPIPDLQIHCLCMGVTGMEPEKLKAMFGLEPGHIEPSPYSFALLPTLLHPKSRGSIRLGSSDPFAPPHIHPNYLSDEDDIRLLMEGVKLCRRIAASPVFDSIRGRELLDTELLKQCPDPESDAYIRAMVIKGCLTVYHPTGTTRMGPASDPHTVVDTHLRVHGLKGLRVADLSVCPEIISGNTNAPAIMIGEKASDIILHDHLTQHAPEEEQKQNAGVVRSNAARL